jgi:uncharacterized protein YacL
MGWLSKYYENKLRPKIEAEVREKYTRKIVVDTSALVDGRMVQLYEENFLDGEFIIPSFVISELNGFVKSGRSVPMEKGRRGLEMIEKLKVQIGMKGGKIKFPVFDEPESGLLSEEVRDRIIYYAMGLQNSIILTAEKKTDKLAEREVCPDTFVRDVKTVNINSIATGLRSVVLRGDRFSIKLVDKGRYGGQCTGYLPDGTLVCVEKSAEFLYRTVPIEITNVLNNLPKGRIAFAELNWGE